VHLNELRSLKPLAIMVPACLGAVLGPFFAIASFVVAFAVGALVFHEVFLAFAGVYVGSLLFGLLGWIAGAYLPTLLALWLSPGNRSTHWAAAFLLVSLYGATLFVLVRTAFILFSPTIAGLLFQILPEPSP